MRVDVEDDGFVDSWALCLEQEAVEELLAVLAGLSGV